MYYHQRGANVSLPMGCKRVVTEAVQTVITKGVRMHHHRRGANIISLKGCRCKITESV